MQIDRKELKMASTEINLGYSDAERSSSRVLKPPGGGHSNIFESPEAKPNPPRPKYNQQNSSNLNAVMGTADPNLKPKGDESGQNTSSDASEHHHAPPAAVNNITGTDDGGQQASGRVRVPPGGFSSGLW